MPVIGEQATLQVAFVISCHLMTTFVSYLSFSAHSHDDRLLTPQLRTGVTEAGGALSAAAPTGMTFVVRDAGYICTRTGVS